MMNPAKLLTFKKDWEAFAGRHPRFVQFLMTVMQNGVGEESIIDVTVTLPDGRTYQSNMKITSEDVDFIKGIGGSM